MLWLFLTITTALAVSTQDAWIKKFFSDLDAYHMAAFPMLYSLPMFLVTAFFIPRPPLDAVFYACILVALPLNSLAILMYMQAIRISPLSLTIPYLAFTPVFMLLTGFLILKETVNYWGIFGIVLICIGSYVLHLQPGRPSILAPFQAMQKERGSWLMLTVAFLFSLAAVVGKKGIIHSSPLFFIVAFFLLNNICLLLLLVMIDKVRLSDLTRRPAKGLVVGTVLYVQAVCHGYAISMVQAAYMISIKRLSILISVVYGRLIFNESNIRSRFIGACWMLAGALLIVLYGS